MNAGTRPGMTSKERADIKRLKRKRGLRRGPVRVLRPLGLATREAGFNCNFHAIRPHGERTVLEKHHVPRHSQRTRGTDLLRQGHATADMVYANAVIAMVRHAGTAPGHATNIPFAQSPSPYGRRAG